MAVMRPTIGPGPAAPLPPVTQPGTRRRSPASQALHRMASAVRSNRKATAGTVLLLFFCLIALFPGVIAHDNPSAEIYGRSLGPSTAHPFGTTAYGQDIFARRSSEPGRC